MWIGWNDVDRTFAALDQFRKRMDRVFDELEAGREAPPAFGSAGRVPRTNLSDEGAAFSLKAELPGLNEKDIQLSVQQNVLTLSGERKPERREGYSVHRQERTPFQFARSFTLPVEVDVERVTASMKDGILTVTLPKVPASQPKQITIKAS